MCKRFSAPLPAGYICPSTGRVAVLVSAYEASDLNGDAWAYDFNQEAEAHGLEPWRLVEAVERDGASYVLVYDTGRSRTVGPLMTFFLTAADAQRLAGA